ncbi:TonB-dependent receptor [Sphingomonas sp. RB3P16]|uniref:TonB-dependent receptor n=1 Tax=Parasphingomonas frigoris TaxID=3096163 RepID=UPI002FC6586F
MKAFFLASASVLCAVSASPGWAQATTSPAAPPVANAPEATAQAEGAVQDIVVTAQRRPERLQNVPVSVTVLGGDTLRSQALNDATQITIATPSLQLGKENSFAIRGIGTLAFSTTIDPSVATAIDEVNIGRPLAGGNSFLDVAQVEVLNGPQGLLFGKNASAGLINITTRAPELNHVGADFDVELDSRPRSGQGAIVRTTLNLPVSENSALRVSGLYNYQDSLTRHVDVATGRYEDDVRQYGVRAKYLLKPTNNLSIYLIGDYNEQHGVSGFSDASYATLAPGSTDAPALAADGIKPGRNNFDVGSDAAGYRDLRNGGAQGKVSFTTDGGVEISNIAAWRFYNFALQADGDSTGADGLNQNTSTSKYNQYSNELRVALPSGSRLSGQAGLFFFRSTVDGTAARGGSNFLPGFLLPQFPFCVGATVRPGGPPNCSVNNAYFLGTDKQYSLGTTSYAGFGQLTYEVTNGLRLIAGGRVTHDKVTIDLLQNQRSYFFAFGASGRFAQEYSNTNFSWRGGVQYNPTQQIMLYATYARGYKGPGFNDTPPTVTSDLTIRPETSGSFEAGVKSTLFDRKLTLNISAFRNKLRNYQAQAFDTVLRTFLTKNAASVTNQGVEVTAVARPVPALTLNGSATFLDSQFDSFAGAQCYPGQANCGADGTFNAGGLTTPSSPKFSATAGATLQRPIANGLSAFIEGNYYHRSSINFTVSGAPGAGTAAIDLLGGSIGVRGDHWNAAIFCKNCTNVVYPNYKDLEAGDATVGIASYIQQFGYNSVRTIGARFGFNF